MNNSSFSIKSKVNNIQTDDLFREITPEELKQLQNALLDMYKDILRVCDKYDIVPYLIGGSALGAVRHQGFIPWDDDLDVGMTRVDYEKFRKIFRKELSEGYRLNAPNFSSDPKARFPKVIKKNTVCREIVDVNDSKRNGIFVDIFILDDVPASAVKRKVKGTFCNGLEFISGQVFLKEHMTEAAKEMYLRMGKRSYLTHYLVGAAFSLVPSRNWFHAVDKAVRYSKNSDYVGIVTGRKHYFGEIFEKKDLFPPVYLPFEDIKAPIFNNYDKYLRNLYGEYMQIPKPEDREKHYIVDLKI